jgi:hypothetical protein
VDPPDNVATAQMDMPNSLVVPVAAPGSWLLMSVVERPVCPGYLKPGSEIAPLVDGGLKIDGMALVTGFSKAVLPTGDFRP